MALVVYGGALSPFVRKVRVVLVEKGLEYSLEPINPFQPTAEFLAISPLKKMPAFRDTDLPEPNTLADSSVICDYLEHKFPSPPLYPTEPYARARALWFEEYADSQMAANIVRPFFFERIVKKFIGQQTDETVCETAKAKDLPEVCEYLSRELGDREYLVGNALSIADIAVATMFVNLQHAGEAIDAARWPNLAAFAERMHARPSFKAFIEEEQNFMQRLRAA
ncbi:MAG TPA: glutathione S-transferase family protein [Rhizomicrobium sp.]|jgi:glutathione S-transferase|nr:glutathione S-transferase family protein [Rhizomicrobium sp.]